MLTKPNIPEELILSRLREEYDLRISSLTFLPLGADTGSIVYRVVTQDGSTYFLKLRKGFIEIAVLIPLLLKSQGIQGIIPPIETRSGQRWTDFGDYKMILYPFIDGKDGFEVDFSDHHWQALGATLKGIHSIQLPPELSLAITKETYSAQWRESLKSSQAQVEKSTFDDPYAVKLAAFMRFKRDEITRLIQRAECLAAELCTSPSELVLCHSDIHGGNLLISDKDELYIVDWDYPFLAAKERDLMFIGGGFIGSGMDDLARRGMEESLFYKGYGKTDINFTALAYYRYERIINDFSAYCEQLFLTEEGNADRQPIYETFVRNFEPGNMIETADKTYNLLLKQEQ